MFLAYSFRLETSPRLKVLQRGTVGKLSEILGVGGLGRENTLRPVNLGWGSSGSLMLACECQARVEVRTQDQSQQPDDAHPPFWPLFSKASETEGRQFLSIARK